MTTTSERRSWREVAIAAAVMTAWHVAARSARDALFLSRFELAWLPWMAGTASVLSIVAALEVSRRLRASGPARLVTGAFAFSTLLTLVEWWTLGRAPGLGTITFYLHVSVVGPILVSGFWLLVSEGLDPRTTRQSLGRVSALATLGGLVGCIVVDRLTSAFGLSAVLPFLALSHAWVTVFIARSMRERPRPHVGSMASPDHGPWWIHVFSDSHRRVLAAIVFGCSLSASLLDFVFKAYATTTTAGDDLGLVRLFLGINGVIVLGTVLLQVLFRRFAIGHTAFLRTVGSVPAVIVLGAGAALAIGVPWLVALVRGIESMLRGSLFRSGYELLYAGIPRGERRTVRTVVDVACDRAGDIVAAGIVAFVLAFLPRGTDGILVFLAAVFAAGTLVFVPRLAEGHRRALEESIRAHGIAASEATPTPERLGWTSLHFGGVNVADPEPARAVDPGGDGGGRRPPVNPPSAPSASARILDAHLVPSTIARLGDETSADAAHAALAPVVGRHVGQLVDALLDGESKALQRSRVAVLLGTCPEARAVDGLSRGLLDPWFEVRSTCALALAGLLGRDGTLRVDRTCLFEAIRREAMYLGQDRETRGIGVGHRQPGVNDFLTARAEQAIGHVFLLLSIQLPGEATSRALRQLRSRDPILRGTALEYMDSILPPEVRDAVWFVLEAAPPVADESHPDGPDY